MKFSRQELKLLQSVVIICKFNTALYECTPISHNLQTGDWVQACMWTLDTHKVHSPMATTVLTDTVGTTGSHFSAKVKDPQCYHV